MEQLVTPLLASPDRDFASSPTHVRLSEVLAGLSYALDLTEGQRPGHAVRTCAIGMRIGEILGLDRQQRSALFYALLMKDLGCSSNASRFAALFAAHDHRLKADLKTVNWSDALESFRFVARNVAPGGFWLRRVWWTLAVLLRGPKGASEVVETRCERGADIARLLGFTEDTVQAIRTLDEHWDGRGQPYAVKGPDIPLLGRIVGLAQTVEVFFSTYGVMTAYDMAFARRGTWFDPEIVDALLSIRTDAAFWQWLGVGDQLTAIASVEPADCLIVADDDYLDLVAEAFARVIDAKSPWTYRHSNGVAEISVGIANAFSFAPHEVRDLRRAALLHDLGKLGISSLILDKPAKLTDAEFAIVRRHPEHTTEILSRVGCFRHLADVAGSHHERLDGKGYHRGLPAASLTKAARVICTADICDALRATRPYRPGLSTGRVLDVMQREVGTGIDADCYAAVRTVLSELVPFQDEVTAVKTVATLAEDYHQAA